MPIIQVLADAAYAMCRRGRAPKLSSVAAVMRELELVFPRLQLELTCREWCRIQTELNCSFQERGKGSSNQRWAAVVVREHDCLPTFSQKSGMQRHVRGHRNDRHLPQGAP